MLGLQLEPTVVSSGRRTFEDDDVFSLVLSAPKGMTVEGMILGDQYTFVTILNDG